MVLVLCVMWRKISSCFKAQKRPKSVLIVRRLPEPEPKPYFEPEPLPPTQFGLYIPPIDYHDFRIKVDDKKTITENTPSQYDHAEIFFLNKTAYKV